MGQGAVCQGAEAVVLGPGPCCGWEVVLGPVAGEGLGSWSKGCSLWGFPPGADPAVQGPVGMDTTCWVHTKAHRHQSLRTRKLVLCREHSEKVALGQLTSEQDRAANPEPRHRAIAGSA